MTIGQLAKKARISTRTLRYYEEIGLLQPSGRSDSNYRVYHDAEIIRLQQILTLQSCGLRLSDIAALLKNSSLSPLEVVDTHLKDVEAKILLLELVRERLSKLALRLRNGESPRTEDLLDMIGDLSLVEQLAAKVPDFCDAQGPPQMMKSMADCHDRLKSSLLDAGAAVLRHHGLPQ